MHECTLSRVASALLPPAVPAAWRPALSKAMGLGALDKIFQNAARGVAPPQIADRLLLLLNASYSVSERDRQEVPRTGPTVVLSNHPFGLLDGVALASLLLTVRPDVKFLVNPALAGLAPLRELTIAIDPFSERKPARANAAGLREALEHLRRGGLLVIFPAGEVSHFDWATGKVCDAAWPEALARFLRMATPQLCILPAFVAGRNSLIFQAAGVVHSALRTALLARELLNKRSAQV